MFEDAEFGKVNYEAYCKAVGGVSRFTGDKLPTWEEQVERQPEIAKAWIAGAMASIAHHIDLGGFDD
jgi:hypothetical protein